ncbi:MAG: YncE family protein [Reyranella sp.]|uniref:YncE family protein n=1 Tax=Reyranella sp. TaxID=1929291 RepID=UPI002731E5BB|nr:YncE family protein [Reyranella sp.]MDP1965373.1 YncE family protein [Reyranella sp.]MDP2374871.1 YncE family protein [Reyranella sp.]
MTLTLTGHVTLPEHRGKGGFDHAAIHAASGHVYVAHTANDAVDVFDREKYLFSIPNLTGVAGALVSDDAQLIFSSNRGENTVGIFAPGLDPAVTKVAVGVRPNGLAYDHGRKLLLAANVGDPAIARSYTLTMVDVGARAVRSSIEVPGRTRWTVFDPDVEVFYVNISEPAVIVVVDARKPTEIAHMIAVPAAGPHGLDLDLASGRLFCACDAGVLVTLDAASCKVLSERPLSGTPDVIFFNRARQHLYVAVGDPGVIDVFDTRSMTSLGRIETEKGAHTLALPPSGDHLYAFLPRTHRAAIYQTNEVTP